MHIVPGDLDGSSIVVPGDHVGIVDVDDRALLVDEFAGRGYALNPTGALVWRLLDGTSALGELIDDIVDAFGASRGEIERSVIGIVGTFGELGLLDNVVRRLESVPIDIEYVDADCAQPAGPAPEPTFDSRYLAAPPNG